MRRRDFVAAMAASAWPLGVPAQSGAPLVGFLNSASPPPTGSMRTRFARGSRRPGSSRAATCASRSAGRTAITTRLPALAAELVAKGVVAIAATGDVASARAARSASATVPIVFTIGGDPVRFGLVESLARPGGNVTGIAFVPNQLGAKRVQLLRDLAPRISARRPADEPRQSQRRRRAGRRQRRGRQARRADRRAERAQRGGDRCRVRRDRARQRRRR